MLSRTSGVRIENIIKIISIKANECILICFKFLKYLINWLIKQKFRECYEFYFQGLCQFCNGFKR